MNYKNVCVGSWKWCLNCVILKFFICMFKNCGRSLDEVFNIIGVKGRMYFGVCFLSYLSRWYYLVKKEVWYVIF